jgi:hypothetical protein
MQFTPDQQRVAHDATITPVVGGVPQAPSAPATIEVR